MITLTRWMKLAVLVFPLTWAATTNADTLSEVDVIQKTLKNVRAHVAAHRDEYKDLHFSSVQLLSSKRFNKDKEEGSTDVIEASGDAGVLKSLKKNGSVIAVHIWHGKPMPSGSAVLFCGSDDGAILYEYWTR